MFNIFFSAYVWGRTKAPSNNKSLLRYRRAYKRKAFCVWFLTEVFVTEIFALDFVSNVVCIAIKIMNT